MNRKEYLQSWKPYPLWKRTPLNPLGRFMNFHSVDLPGLHCLRLVIEIEIRDFLLPSELSEVWRSVLLPGDWIGLTLSQAGEVAAIKLLAPNLSAEFPYMHPAELLSQRKKNITRWGRFQTEVRSFFESREFLHVETPTLVTCPGYELHLEPFATEFHFGRRREKLFLPTSPELHLKKVLAMGFTQIFEIKKVFRNAEISPSHSPEFTMIEWYRTGSLLDEILVDVQNLIRCVFEGFKSFTPFGQERKNDEGLRFETWTFREIFLKEFGYPLQPELNFYELKELCEQRGLKIPQNSTADDLFHLLWIEILEPALPTDIVICVRNFPKSQAALAQLGEDGFADRFEIYYRGFEIANAFQELNDPAIQVQRFEAEILERKKMGRSEVGRDNEFFASLTAGLPPCAGIALGLDRLFMALSGLKEISELTLFPFK